VPSWDRLSAAAYAKNRDLAVREQVRDAIAPFSPFWRQRLGDLAIAASSIDGVPALDRLPAVGERDVSPAGDPAGMAALVLQASETGFALHAAGPTLRRALGLRLLNASAYRRVVTSDTRPTSYVWAGLGFRFPIGSTRGDLDAIARAGARAWRVLGLSDADALLSAVPVASTTEHVALQLAALASGAPALFPGDDPEAVLAAARLAAPTVIAAPSEAAADVVDDLASADVDLSALRTLLLVGAPSQAQRHAAEEALHAVAPKGVALAVHAPSGARVLWAECRESRGSTGLHTYPDLDVVSLIDPETGSAATGDGEVVLTQLGMRGSALLRWRTGDLAGAVTDDPCPACARRVARVSSDVTAGALVVAVGGRGVDLRAVAGALVGRADVLDWRVVVDRPAQAVRVHVVPDGERNTVAAGVAADVLAASGVDVGRPTVSTPSGLERLAGAPLTARILVAR
jgi:hypothetical protein